MKTIYMVVNQASGSGQGKIVYDQASQFYKERQIPFTSYLSEYQFHTIELTNQIIGRSKNVNNPMIVVIGGDGTLHEVVKTLHGQGERIPVLYLPAGTGNDFHRTWQTKHSLEQLLQKTIVRSQVKELPLFHTTNLDTGSSDIILNSLGYGIDGQVIASLENMSDKSPLRKILNGKPAYWLAAIMAGLKLPRFSVTIGQDDHQTTYSDCQLVGCFNSPYFGGGIQISPDIDKEDPSMNLLIFQGVNLFTFISIFFNIAVRKQKADPKYVTHLKFTDFTLRIENPVSSQVDGELRPRIKETLHFSQTTYPFIL